MTAKRKKPAKNRPYRKRLVRKKPKRFGICVDSLQQIQPAHLTASGDSYELVIIDESEQVFRHLFSDTITSRGTQDRIYKTLREIVRRAGYVVALDADLGYLTSNTLARMVSDQDADEGQLGEEAHPPLDQRDTAGGRPEDDRALRE